MLRFGVPWKRINKFLVFICASELSGITEVTNIFFHVRCKADTVMLILHSSLWSALAHRLNQHQWLWSVDEYCTRNDSIFPFQTVLFSGGAIICILLKFPVFRRYLSFLWVGLVQDKGFPLPTSIRGLQKRHLIVAMVCLRLCRQGKGFSLSCMQLVQQREIAKFASFPAFSTLDFPGSVLSPFFFSASFHLLLPWRMKCLFHSSCRLNRFWGWWMVRISYPSFSKHRPCLFLDISLARDWQSVSGSWKGGWQCPAEMLFHFVDEISSHEKVLRASVQSLVLKLRHECSLEWMFLLPQSTQGKKNSYVKPVAAYDCISGGEVTSAV